MMISFNSDMQKEKLAAIGLAVIIIGALSTYLIAEHWDEILENLSENGEKENTIELGDCADVNYVGKLANGTVFDTSYEDVAKEWGLQVEGREYSPLKRLFAIIFEGILFVGILPVTLVYLSSLLDYRFEWPLPAYGAVNVIIGCVFIIF